MRLLFLTVMTLLSISANCQVSEFQLNNGMKVIIKEDHRAPVAVSMVWYKVGSADEPGGMTGVSHALEHMMFKGTPKYPQGFFSKTIAKSGGQENAFTNYDYTAYFEKLSSDKLSTSLKLEADRMRNLLLDPKEFSREIKVIQEERRMRTDDNPQALTFERFMATAHLAMPYQHPVIGWMSDLRNMTIDDLRYWYQKYYAPNNATLVVVGDVDPQKVFRMAKTYFSDIETSQMIKRKKQPEPPSLGKKSVIVKAPAKLPLVILGYTTPSVKTADNDYEPYALELIAGILDAGDSARFAKELVRGKHVASNIQVYYNLYARYQPQFVIYGIPSQGNDTKKLKSDIINELDKIKKALVSGKELDKVKNQIIAQKTFEKDSIFGQAMEIGLLETVGIGWKESQVYTQKIKAITPEQIQKTAKRYFKDIALTEANLIPVTQAEGRAS